MAAVSSVRRNGPEEHRRRRRSASLVAGIGYASLIERNAFVVREVTMPVLVAGLHAAAGAAPQRHPHAARRSGASRRGCASWPAGSPTSSSTPATTCRTRRRCPPSCRRSATCCRCPACSCSAATTTSAPRLKNPANYLTNPSHRIHGEPLPWQDLRAAFTERGWLDMTHTRREFEVAGLHIAAAGVDDPHI